jgi:hypothetical protein
MTKYWLNKRLSNEHKLKISESRKGQKRSEETCKKISESHKGMVFSENRKKNISKSKIGKKRPEMSGNKHPMWKGGITPVNKLIRHSSEFKEWRKLIFERDGYTCQKCNKKCVFLHPHHIESFNNNPDLRTEIDNGITLCKSCHMDFHHIFGRGNNTRQQLKLFLKNHKQ